jgi:soluble lytic murein transglycosylase
LLGALATVYAKENNYEKVIETRRRMLKQSRSSGAAAKISSKIAFLLMDQGKYGDAIDEFKKTLRMRGGSKHKAEVSWNIAWCYYMKGDYRSALAKLNAISSSKLSGAAAEKTAYWKARTLENLGDEKAMSIYKNLAESKPAGYYGYLSLKRLVKNSDDFSKSPFKRNKIKPYKPTLSSAYFPDHLAKAVELDRLGISEEVGRELKSLSAADVLKNPDEVMYLASKNSAHDSAFRFVNAVYSSDLKSENPSALNAKQVFVWQQAYPKAWFENVIYETLRRGVDPALVWSIMRSESNFRPKVTSPAGAVGLMQVMPFTAKKLMKLGNENGCFWDLYRPPFNIMLSVLYLKELNKMFDGNITAVIASYNAGEEAVGRWLDNGGKMGAEEWVEEIPYAETNLYVKKVMAAYWTYKTLY